jgi:hypothetical protein
MLTPVVLEPTDTKLWMENRCYATVADLSIKYKLLPIRRQLGLSESNTALEVGVSLIAMRAPISRFWSPLRILKSGLSEPSFGTKKRNERGWYGLEAWGA